MNNKIKKMLAVLLCATNMVGASSISYVTKAQSSTSTDNWSEIQGILSQYGGEWTDTIFSNKVSKLIPQTAILGNGDVGISSAGDADTKTFNISKSDFWESTGPTSSDKTNYGWPLKAGSITLSSNATTQQDESDINLAPTYKTVTTSSGSNGDSAVNGRGNDPYDMFTGWYSNGTESQPWIMLEFNDEITFNYWEIYNYSFYVDGVAGKNIRGGSLQTSDDGTEWTTVSTFTGGQSATMFRLSLDEAVTTKYVRLLVTEKSTTSGAPIRVGQLQLFNKQIDETIPQNLVPNYLADGGSVSVSSKTSGYTAEAAVNGLWADGINYKGWYSNKITTGYAWLKLNMGKDITFNRFIIRNEGANNPSSTSDNTKDCEVQISSTGNDDDWTTVKSITGNTENVIKVDLDQEYTAQYVRLYITNPNQGETLLNINTPKARIGAFELYDIPEGYVDSEDSDDSASATEFKEVQDIEKAEIRTNQTLKDINVDITSYLSETDNIFIQEVKSLETDKTGTFSVLLETVPDMDWRTSTSGTGDDYIYVTRESTPGTTTENGLEFTTKVALATKIIGATSSVTEDREDSSSKLTMTLQPGQTAYIVTTVGGGGMVYDGNGDLIEGRTEPLTEAISLLDKASTSTKINNINQEHQEWWKDYWMKSYIKLGETEDGSTDSLMDYYYGAQYFMGAALREGGLASGLYGIWHTTDCSSWHSDFHMNYNFTSAYYGSASSNRAEQLLPAVESMVDYIPQAMANAGSTDTLNKIYSSYVSTLISLGQVDATDGIQNAALFPVSVGPWGMTLEYDSYHGETVNTPYAAIPMIEYYNATMDDEFLEDTMYPFLKLVNTFFINWACETSEGSGVYTFKAGYNESYKGTNPAVELAAYKYCLKYGIDASNKFGIDSEEREKWEKVYNGLPDQPIYSISGKDTLGLAEGVSPIPSDGNSIVLESVIPFEVYGYYSSDSELDTLKNTIDTFSAAGKFGQINSFPKIFTAAVNSRYDINTVVDELVDVLYWRMKENGTVNDGMHGMEKFGNTATINSMLLLSDQGVTKMFGNWLEDVDAEFVDLRATGAFLFSAKYDGATKEVKENASMFSEAGKTATVASLWDDGMSVVDENGNSVATTLASAPNHDDEMAYTFDTEAGKTYYFVKVKTAEDVASEIVSIDAPEKGDTVLTLPEVADGFTVEIKSSSDPSVIALDGTVTPKDSATTVNLVLTVTKTDDSTTADTISIAVTVPEKLFSKSDLQSLITEAESLNINHYTETTANIFSSALNNANSAKDQSASTALAIDEAYKTLKAAIDALEFNNYSIIYNLDGGINNSENPDNQNSGTSLTLKNPSKAGYLFAGWFTESSFTNKVTAISEDQINDVTLYANWIPVNITESNTDVKIDLTDTTLPEEVKSVRLNVSLENTPRDKFLAVKNYLANNPLLGSSNDFVLYSVEMLDQDDQPVDFSGKVKVKMPIPEGMSKNLKVYWLNEADNTLVDMNAVEEDGYLVFNTTHFSYYAITEAADSSSDTSDTDTDSDTTDSDTSGTDTENDSDSEVVTNPSTGDNNNLNIVMIFFCFSLCVTLFTIKRKKYSNKI